MSLLDGMRKARGRQQSASGASPRLRRSLRSNNRLPADRIAAALGTLPVAPTAGSPSRSARRIPNQLSVSGTTFSPPVVAESGRHRGGAEQLDEWFPPPPADPVSSRHGRASGNELGEFSRVGSRRAKPVIVVPVPVVPEGGRHRRTAPPKRAILTVPVALMAAGAKSRRMVALGVLVLLVAVAVAFGVRAALAPPVAQPELIATTTQGQLEGESGAVQLPSRPGLL